MFSTALLGAMLLGVDPAHAQYFGRNRVNYERFDWKVLRTDHFDIHYYPEAQVPVEDAARMAERWYGRLSRLLQHEFSRNPVILYANHPDFQQTNVLGGGTISEGTGGVTEGLRNRVILPFTGVYRDNDHVLGHELVHAFQYSIAQSPQGGGLQGMSRLPLWLIEGMAEYLSLGRDDPNTALWLRDAALRGELPTIRQLTTDPRFFPYRYGQALWAYIGGRWGDRTVADLYRRAIRIGWTMALDTTLGMSEDSLSREWIGAIRATYLPLIVGRTRATETARALINDDDERHMNVNPVISPDGRWAVFFSSRGLFGIDLYLADVRTGEVVKKLASPSRTPHLEALSFISTAGTWSPDGRRLAFVIIEEGDSRIAVLDVNSQDIVQRIGVEGVGSIQNPAWSPDGQSIAFSGTVGGVSDLFVYDLQSRSARRLTNDRNADLQPTWSPDGRSLAFATDRGPETDFERLTFSPMHLAIIDVASGQIRPLSIFPDANHRNPQFSPDGSSLYFVSDRAGFSDVFRVELASGRTYQVTNLATGISGITALSPAMSVARQTGDIVFSVFEGGRYAMYALSPDRGAGTPIDAAPTTSVAGILPPVVGADRGVIGQYLEDPVAALPQSTTEFPVRDYNPNLRLDYVGPPTFGVSTGGFGTGFAGGASVYFSDMLGDRAVAAAVQAQGTFKDVGAQVIYQNLERRWSWGFGAGHVPYLTGFATRRVAGNEVIDSLFLDRIFVDQATLISRYPFNVNRRLELTAGYTRLSFDREIQVLHRDLRTGAEISFDESDGLTPDALNFIEASAAFVGDNSFFGFTSPIIGWRYRFQVTPTFGTWQYQTALADYRRYFIGQPVTLAIRGLHYGRYGRDASRISRQSPLYLGYEALVRGYARESFEVSECRSDASTGCPAFDRLIGSKLAVANIELRAPLFGVEDYGLINFPFVPTDIAVFFDAGAAWGGLDGRADTDLELRFDRDSSARVPVFSTGVSARFNVLGYLILEAYYAYPFQRPDKGGHIGFQLAPGW